MKIHYLLHTENYRIGFVTPKVWAQNDRLLKNWFFNYHTYWPDIRIEVTQLCICGLSFGHKKQIR